MARRINLVPQSERSRTTTNVGMLGLVAAVIIVVFAVGLGYYLLKNSLNDRKDELQYLKEQTQTLQTQVAALKKYDSLASDRDQAESTVQEIYAGRTLVSDILDSLSLVTPENVWLQSLEMTTLDPGVDTTETNFSGDNSVTMNGSTYSFEDVAQFLVRLQLVPGLTGVKLQSAADTAQGEQASGQVKEFSVDAVVNPPSEEVVLPVSQVEVEGL